VAGSSDRQCSGDNQYQRSNCYPEDETVTLITSDVRHQSLVPDVSFAMLAD